MKTFCLLLLASTVSVAQDFTASSAFHMSSEGTILGVAGSANLMTWNSRKVILRVGGAYFSGSSWTANAPLTARNRFEMFLESKNTMITGESYFNVLEIGYQLTQSRTQLATASHRNNDYGLFFSAGLGLRVVQPVSVMVRYISGFDSGARLGFDYDF